MYAKLKDLIVNMILSLKSEPALGEMNPGKVVFSHFADDDIGGAVSVKVLTEFLHEHYFP